MKRRYYVTQIRKTKQGYKYIFIPRDFPSDWAYVKIYESFIEIRPYYPQEQEKHQEQKQDNDPDLFEEFDKMQRGL